MARASVRVNVYDMYWLNEYASPLGVGVFHAGIEVYGVEYAYGGHPFAFSGIFELTPQSADELGENFRFREAIMLGETDFSASDIRRIVQQMGLDYRGDQYHLINRNCNHFSDALAKTLTGREIPAWINRLANLSASVPFISRMIPSEWLTPIALQQTLDSRDSLVATNTERKVNPLVGSLGDRGGTVASSSSSSTDSSSSSNSSTANGSMNSGRSPSNSTTTGNGDRRTVTPTLRESGIKRCSQ